MVMSQAKYKNCAQEREQKAASVAETNVVLWWYNVGK